MTQTELTINPIFGALTRPAMVGGVTFEYHMLNLMISMCVFIALSPVYGLIFIPLHLFGWMVCWYDIHFFSICVSRFLKLPQMPNSSIWKVRAYEPF
jgi:type IV secretion system protein VirB3